MELQLGHSRVLDMTWLTGPMRPHKQASNESIDTDQEVRPQCGGLGGTQLPARSILYLMPNNIMRVTAKTFMICAADSPPAQIRLDQIVEYGDGTTRIHTCASKHSSLKTSMDASMILMRARLVNKSSPRPARAREMEGGRRVR